MWQGPPGRGLRYKSQTLASPIPTIRSLSLLERIRKHDWGEANHKSKSRCQRGTAVGGEWKKHVTDH